MRTLFVTGTGTDVGKTWVAAALARALAADGARVDVFKPLISGFDPDSPQGSDAAVLLAAIGRAATAEEIARVAPFRFLAPQSPPLAAHLEGREILFDAVVETCARRIAADDADWLIIEGAGGVMSPVSDDQTGLSLIAALGIPAVLVGGSYLGAISHALTALEVMRLQRIEVAAVVISETADSTAPLGETTDAVARMGAVATLTAPRGDPAFAVRLAGLVR